MLVQTPLRKSWEWEVTTRILSSRWFVGSSSRSSAGLHGASCCRSMQVSAETTTAGSNLSNDVSQAQKRPGCSQVQPQRAPDAKSKYGQDPETSRPEDGAKIEREAGGSGELRARVGACTVQREPPQAQRACASLQTCLWFSWPSSLHRRPDTSASASVGWRTSQALSPQHGQRK
eukprot:3931997-Rhodomonas_salina.1